MVLSPSSMVRIALFAGFIALGSYIRIPLGPVPFTLQNLFVGLAGFLLGPREGVMAWAVFLAAGLLGLPVFPSGGGLGLLLHPTFGFVVGFGLCAWICGRFGRGLGAGPAVAAVACWGFGAIYLTGVPWLWCALDWVVGSPISLGRAFQLGCLIFLPTDLVKVAALAFLAPRIARALNRGVDSPGEPAGKTSEKAPEKGLAPSPRP